MALQDGFSGGPIVPTAWSPGGAPNGSANEAPWQVVAGVIKALSRGGLQSLVRVENFPNDHYSQAKIEWTRKLPPLYASDLNQTNAAVTTLAWTKNSVAHYCALLALNQATGGATSVAGNGGETWTQIGTIRTGSNGNFLTLWRCNDLTGGNTTGPTWTGGGTNIEACLIQFPFKLSGLDGSAQGGGGAGSALSLGPFASVAHDLLIAAVSEYVFPLYQLGGAPWAVGPLIVNNETLRIFFAGSDVASAQLKLESISTLGGNGWDAFFAALTVDTGSLVQAGQTGVVARWRDPRNYYYAYLDNTTVYLKKRVDGVSSTLGTYSTTTAADTFVTLKLDCAGTTITLFVDGVQRIQVTDTTLASGLPGLWADCDDAVNARADDFECTSPTAGAARTWQLNDPFPITMNMAPNASTPASTFGWGPFPYLMLGSYAAVPPPWSVKWFGGDPIYEVFTTSSHFVSITGSGGCVVSGAASVVRKRVVTGASGARVSGAAGIVRKRIVTGSSGVRVSGAATLIRKRLVAGSSGVRVSGAATIQRSRAIVGSSGVRVSGAATFVRKRVLTGASGARVNGAAVIVRKRIVAGSSGAIVDGTAARQRSRAVTGSSGVVVSGAATIETSSSGHVSITGSGGVKVSGAATLQRTRVITGSSGVQCSGAATQQKTRVLTGSSGARVSGAATLAALHIRSITGSSGAQLSGAAVLRRSRVVTGSSGARVSGAATLAAVHLRSITGSGGVRCSGAATLKRIRVVAGSSGVRVSGAATLTRRRNLTGTGGVRCTGSAGLQRTRKVTGSSGARVSGSATLRRTRVLAGASGVRCSGAATLKRIRVVRGASGVRVSGHAATGTRFRAIVGSGGVRVSGSGQPESVQGFLPGAIFQTQVQSGLPAVDGIGARSAYASDVSSVSGGSLGSMSAGHPAVDGGMPGLPYEDDFHSEIGE